MFAQCDTRNTGCRVNTHTGHVAPTLLHGARASKAAQALDASCPEGGTRTLLLVRITSDVFKICQLLRHGCGFSKHADLINHAVNLVTNPSSVASSWTHDKRRGGDAE